LDTKGLCPFTDYFVICSADTEPQIEAIRDSINNLLSRKARLLHLEGEAGSGWVLMDFGDVIVHIFSPAQREYYKLEKIWSKAAILFKV